MASNLDIIVNKTTDTTVNFRVRNSDGSVPTLTGYTAKAQLKVNLRATTAADTLTTSNSRITIDTDTAVISLSFPKATVSAYTKDRYLYDLVITSSGSVSTKIAQGVVIVEPGVTTI